MKGKNLLSLFLCMLKHKSVLLYTIFRFFMLIFFFFECFYPLSIYSILFVKATLSLTAAFHWVCQFENDLLFEYNQKKLICSGIAFDRIGIFVYNILLYCYCYYLVCGIISLYVCFFPQPY